jgi:hypothetical protein
MKQRNRRPGPHAACAIREDGADWAAGVEPIFRPFGMITPGPAVTAIAQREADGANKIP